MLTIDIIIEYVRVITYLGDRVEGRIGCSLSVRILQNATLGDVIQPCPSVHLASVQVQELPLTILHVVTPRALVAVAIGCMIVRRDRQPIEELSRLNARDICRAPA